ncbi:hypothetical protein [Sphingomonas qomolangmaensis]|uniref:Sensor histidine kinase n=1 Tax=Sphingomonas qomolangmaensis TaxID=2918765 RepID=A0ABY5L7N1_9SPHN|nr:hypothetical protein [Sphingomonas qomolangmaensis]UUL81603.1 hypothetical protein NMP03_10360 [Sphingomonas qomolangmaensis]
MTGGLWQRDLVSAVVVAVGATLFWLAANRLGGTREPWDGPYYWSLTYPAAIAVCAVLGGVFPRRAWLWALILILAQVPVMIAAAGTGPLLPIGIVFALFLSLPAVAIAEGVAFARRPARRG